MTGSTEHPGGMGQASDTKQLRRRRLDVPGTKVHLEPVTSGEGRPLREPRPREAPYDGPSSQETFSRETFSQGRSSRSPVQGELFAEPGKEQAAPGPLMAGEVPSGTGLAHRWHRRRGLFAELRALERSEEAGKDQASEDQASEGRASEEQASGDRACEGQSGGDDSGDSGGSSISRDKGLSFRLTSAQARLLSEGVACSHYRGRSAYLQAAATGRDRRASPIGKAGLLFFWTWAHFGTEIGTEEQDQLRRLAGFLLGTEGVGEALALIRRHLRAARLAASGELEGSELEGEKLESGEGLPAAPERIRRRRKSDPKLSASTRICRERKRMIRENAGYSTYDNLSEHIRHVVLGWDRNAEIRAQCATIAEWMENCREAGPREAGPRDTGYQEEGGLGGQVGPRDWERLDDAMHRRFGIFLSGPGAAGQVDVEGALRRGTKHLLGAAPETFARRVPATL